MAYQSVSFVFGEQPSAAKWNLLGSNDASFNDGTGLPMAGSDSATVATSQTTTSTSYTDLSTAGPAVTVTIGNTGKAYVTVGCALESNTAGNGAVMSWVASGANTIAVADAQSVSLVNSNLANSANANLKASFGILQEGLTAGSTTFTAKYRAAGGGTATFASRYISVIPL